ncbi:MAG: hypothetical protein RL660_2695 [Bacteroidota bacterium]
MHAIITDPPYGINFQNNEWDKSLPPSQIWSDCFEALKPGGYAAVFSAVRLMHRLMVQLEDAGFIVRDVMMWGYLNGMPKSRDVALDIDKELGVASKAVGQYKYVQGYKKGGADSYTTTQGKAKLAANSKIGKQFAGSGLGIKPAYEPIILVQKPLEKKKTAAQNMIAHGTGALNLEASRIPYEAGEGKVGHNPHPKGRVTANIVRTDSFEDGYDKFFLVPKVRQHADDFNNHPTIKPVQLMEHLVNLLSWQDQTVLDPFMGSGSTGLACKNLDRQFEGYELEKAYFDIAKRRLL